MLSFLLVVLFLFTIAAAAVIAGVVIMGMQGRGKSNHPRLAHKFARFAQALNGEGEPPRHLGRVFDPAGRDNHLAVK